MLAPAATPPEPPAVVVVQQQRPPPRRIVLEIFDQRDIMMGTTLRGHDWGPLWVPMDQRLGVALDACRLAERVPLAAADPGHLGPMKRPRDKAISQSKGHSTWMRFMVRGPGPWMARGRNLLLYLMRSSDTDANCRSLKIPQLVD